MPSRLIPALLLAIVLTGTLGACSSAPANAGACAKFAKTYGMMAEATTASLQGSGSSAAARNALSNSMRGYNDAIDLAQGKVRAAMVDTARLLELYVSDESLGRPVDDDGTAFFYSTLTAQQACAAAGSPIKLAQIHR